MRIGIISPYPGFSEVARKVAAEQNVQVEIEQAWLEQAAQIAERWESDRRVDAVVARGLTAHLIRQRLTRLPVVAIEVTGYDLMQALYQARQLGERIAYIDYDGPERPYDLGEITRLLGFPFTPMLYQSRQGILRQLVRARKSGCDVVVTTGMVALSRAEAWQMRAVIVPSSPMAIRDALLQAVAELQLHRRTEYRDKWGQAVLEHSREGIIVVDPRGRVTVYNPAAERILGLPASEVQHRPAPQIGHAAFSAIYGDGAEASGLIREVDGREFVISRVPITVAGQPAGTVITFQSATVILRLEEAIRRQLHAKGLTARYQFSDILGESPQLVETIAKARRFARSDLTVLITGESGTGKELFAHAIHRASPRSEGAFVAVNCAALPENLLESELFGYAEGAFTGARKGGKPGLFELAHGGTIFLDEIGELPLPLQSRLLRVLQEREVMRVGGDRMIPVNVRVVAATNRRLEQAVQAGRFREDLYYRLDVLDLQVPPLRHRRQDIRTLAAHFLRVSLPPACLDALCQRPWLGNVRELKHFLMKCQILADGAADPGKLLSDLLAEDPVHRAPSTAPTAAEDEIVVRVGTMEEMEQQILRHLGRRPGMDRAELARRLGISRTTLWKKLREPEPAFNN